MLDTRPRILCVDDDARILDGLALHLRRKYAFEATTDPREALSRLESDADYAVLLTDLRMPGMSGLQIVAEARQRAPDTSRLILSGEADRESVLSAINDGSVTRFLTKPCRPDALLAAVAEGTRAWAAIGEQREQERRNIRGLLTLMMAVMHESRSTAAARVTRICDQAVPLSKEVGVDPFETWVAVVVAHLADLVTPPEISDKAVAGIELDGTERTASGKARERLAAILSTVPAVASTRQALRVLEAGRLGRAIVPPEVMRLANVVAICAAFDALLTQGCSTQLAVDTLRGRRAGYDKEILEAFAAQRLAAPSATVRELPLIALRAGMVFAQDLRLRTGPLLVHKGHEVTEAFLARSHNFGSGRVAEPIRMYLDEAEAAES